VKLRNIKGEAWFGSVRWSGVARKGWVAKRCGVGILRSTYPIFSDACLGIEFIMISQSCVSVSVLPPPPRDRPDDLGRDDVSSVI